MLANTTEACRCPIILLVDWQLDDKKYWLQPELEKLGFHVTPLGLPSYNLKNHAIKWRKIILWIDFLKLGWHGAQMAQYKEGVVVTCNFQVGVFASLCARIISKENQPVIALNMIARTKGFFNQILRRLVYQTAFMSDKLLLTVNASDLRDQYLKTFKIRPKNISVLHDPWWPSYEISLPSLNDDEFIFSGGEAARDWDTLLSVATACPDIRFKIVARRKNWGSIRNVTSNVDVLFDTSPEEFFSLAARARLIILPLVSKVTAGLIVLIKSILMGKMVIATDTPATASYYPTDCRDLLVPESDVEKMISRLKYYWLNHQERMNKATNVQNHIIQYFSPEAYAKQVSDLIAKVYPKVVDVSFSGSEDHYSSN
jgi:glycosyltransferase involved in cell wall biosynthesis